MRKAILILIIITVYLFTVTASAQYAGSYLNMGVGARALGMGNAFSALADDATAAYYNPAGLTQLGERQMSTMHAILDSDRRYNFLNYVSPLKEKAFYGISWLKFGVVNIEARDQTGNLTGYFDDSEDCFLGTYSFKVSDSASLGFNLKYYRQVLYEFRADGFGLDAGLFYRPDKYFSAGLVMRDASTDLKWNTASQRKDKIPVKIITGMAFRPKDYLTILCDFNKVQEENITYHLGIEGWFDKKVGLRLGVNDGNITLGTSFKQNDWIIEYGFEDGSDEDIHRISGIIRFNM
ncbi:MAG: PorV/PorQ family protein [Bacteroidota bacterium]